MHFVSFWATFCNIDKVNAAAFFFCNCLVNDSIGGETNVFGMKCVLIFSTALMDKFFIYKKILSCVEVTRPFA